MDYKKFINFFVKENKKKLFFYLFINLINLILEILGLSVFLLLIVALLDSNNDIQILNYFEFFKNNITYTLLLLLILFFIKTIFQIYCTFYQKKIEIDFEKKIFIKLLTKYLFLDFEDSSKINSVIKLRYLTSETKSVILYFSSILKIITEIIYVTGILTFLLFNYVKLTLIILITILFVGVVYYLFFKSKLTSLSKKRIFFDNILYKKIIQGIHGLNEIKIYSLENFILKKIEFNLDKVNKYNLYSSFISSTPKYFFEFVTILIFVSTIFILKSIFNYDNSLIIETLAVLALCLLRSFPSFSKILAGFQELNSRLPSVEVISEQLSEKETPIFINNMKFNIEKFRSINLENISFRYNKNDEYILKDLNLSFNKGDIIGFFGKTGSGKSTLTNIISGLIKPSTGKIFVNKKNIERVPHNYFSYVPQKPLIINDTIKSNIAFGIENENIDSTKLNYALEKCELREFIQKLPSGINEIISEDGKNISGGQAQRISIARAIYFDRQILILDESTNSLDLETEKNIINFLNQLKYDITIIMISHNLENLKICNEVYELKEKKLNKIK